MRTSSSAWMKPRTAAILLALPCLLPDAPWARHRPGPECLQAPAEADFGSAAVGDSATLEATFRNACRHPVSILSLAASPAAFGVATAAPVRIPGRGSASVTLRFGPADTGSIQGRLGSRSSDSRRESIVALKGTGAAGSVRSGNLEVSPARIDETLPQGHTAGKPITIRNLGADSLPVYVETLVNAPGAGGDTAGAKLSVLYLSTILMDDVENNFIYVLNNPHVSRIVIRSGEQRTPDLSELLPHDLVVVSGYNKWADPDSAGNLLADYVDQGGTVVLMHRALDTTSQYGFALGGRIVTPQYSPVARGGMAYGTDVPTLFFEDHTLTQSMRWFVTFSAQRAELQGKGRALGYGGGNVALAYNPERPVYFINLVPYEPDYSGQNSLRQFFLNLADQMLGTRNWLKNPVPNNDRVFTLAPGETRQMMLPVGHAYPLRIGTHDGTLRIWSKYPQSVGIPAALRVTGP